MTDQSEDPVGARVDPSQPFSIAIEPQPDVVRIAPRGELDLATADQFQREIGQLVDAGFMRIVIDLRGVVFLDSTALHVLMPPTPEPNRTTGSLQSSQRHGQCIASSKSPARTIASRSPPPTDTESPSPLPLAARRLRSLSRRPHLTSLACPSRNSLLLSSRRALVEQDGAA
jgi:anti-anti-sigma factor